MTTHANTTSIPHLDVNDGHNIPQLGFGVFQVAPEDTAEVVRHALGTGYRSIDTAAMYGNENGVGEAVAQSGLDRDEVFITTKLANDMHGHDNALRALDESLRNLGMDYVDLYLIHWPRPSDGKFVDTWQAFTELKQEGRARSIGVSNFRVEDLEAIIDATGVPPAVNQIELHPRFAQSELRRAHAKHDILTEAWSPLGQGELIDDATIARIAADHDRTPAQVILRWHIQLRNVVIPKSVTPARIEENFRVFDFELSDDDMRAIGELDSSDGRIGPDPATFG
jgi:2,5-diketo-D-gluconate reductase A